MRLRARGDAGPPRWSVRRQRNAQRWARPRSATREGYRAGPNSPGRNSGREQPRPLQDGHRQDGHRQDGPRQDGPRQDGHRRGLPRQAASRRARSRRPVPRRRGSRCRGGSRLRLGGLRLGRPARRPRRPTRRPAHSSVRRHQGVPSPGRRCRCRLRRVAPRRSRCLRMPPATPTQTVVVPSSCPSHRRTPAPPSDRRTPASLRGNASKRAATLGPTGNRRRRIRSGGRAPPAAVGRRPQARVWSELSSDRPRRDGAGAMALGPMMRLARFSADPVDSARARSVQVS